MELWEYKVDSGASLGGRLSSVELLQALNRNGEEGWELVNIISSEEVLFIYKRSIPVNPSDSFRFKFPLPSKRTT